jgi:hypothetical protein
MDGLVKPQASWSARLLDSAVLDAAGRNQMTIFHPCLNSTGSKVAGRQARPSSVFSSAVDGSASQLCWTNSRVVRSSRSRMALSLSGNRSSKEPWHEGHVDVLLDVVFLAQPLRGTRVDCDLRERTLAALQRADPAFGGAVAARYLPSSGYATTEDGGDAIEQVRFQSNSVQVLWVPT